MSDPTISGHGFTVQLPASWEGRIYRRDTPATAFSPANRAAAAAPTGSSMSGAVPSAAPAPNGWLGEQTRAVLHLGNFPLPADRGDYGSGAVEMMRAADTFIAIIEFGPECLGTALYSQVGLPRVSADRFDPNGLQRRLPGQCGAQYFFTERSRPMCLYVVLGSYRSVGPLSAKVNTMLDRITVAA